MSLTMLRTPDEADARPPRPSTTTVGVVVEEEEFLLVSTTTARMAATAARRRQTIPNELHGHLRTEVHSSRVDTASPVCHQLSERGASLRALLAVLARGSAGTPPLLVAPPAPGADNAPWTTGPVSRTETDW
jgi:hypothetical protein